MSATIQRRLWVRPLPILFLLASAAPVLRAEPPPLPRATQERVNKAVDRGVRFLYGSQGRLGSWSADGKHAIGYTALPGLTLLECGESALEPAVQLAANLVRLQAPTLDTTYEIALSILFLDRLGNADDEKLIQVLAARLIAGQTATGGWSYRCPILSPKYQKDLLKVLRQLDDQPHFDPDLLVTGGSSPLTGSVTPSKSPGSDSSSASSSSSQRSPGESVAVGLELKPALKSDHVSLPLAGWCIKMAEDASKTNRGGKGKPPVKVRIPQWLKRLPVLMDPARVFRVKMDPVEKGQQIRGTTDNSNSQFATLALWAARRHGVPMKRSLNLLVYRYRTSQNADGSWAYRYAKGGGLPEGAAMTCVGLLGLAVGHGITRDRDRLDPQAAARRARDPQLIKGLAALSRKVGQPAGRLFNLEQPNLYFLWSVERVGVLYNLPTIGGKQWYRWAAECLVANQQQLGNWTKGGYPGATPVIDTCLALLVLKKANLASDLTNQLKLSPGELASSVEKHLAPPPPSPKTPKPSSRGIGKLGTGGKGKDKSYKPPTPPTQPDLSAGTPSQPPQPSATPGKPPTASTTSAPSSNLNAAGGDEKGGGKKLWMILVCVAGVLLLGLSIALLLMSRNRDQAPAEGMAVKKKKAPGKPTPGGIRSKKVKK